MANPSINANPWKGLNFYKEGEILYGRNNEIESLSQYILNNTQTVLYGKSGIGKSSILNAGIFPIARTKGMIPVPIRLDHSNDVSYIDQIRTAISESGADIHEILPPIDAKTESLWEYFHRNIFFDANGNRVQLLIVLDQFEEVFTLQQDEKVKRAFFEEIADLINEVTPLYIVNATKGEDVTSSAQAEEVDQSLNEIDFDFNLDATPSVSKSHRYLEHPAHHIVFTLREDFLSYLERYTAYIPAMKSNRFALLPLNEEQAADIIMKPMPGLVDKEVAKLIIQKVTGHTSFELDGIPEIDVDAAILSLYLSRLFIKKKEGDPITAELVNQFSTDIIKDFYEESVADLPEKEIEKIEEQLLTYDGRRNNVSLNDLIRDGVSHEVISTLVEDRKLLRQFSYQNDLRVEFMHDILCPIVNERIEKREEQHKRKALAAQAQAEKERMEKEARQQRRKNAIRLGIVGALLFIASMAWLAVLVFDKIEFKTDYASFTTKDGWPVGIGKVLHSKDSNEVPVYYRLIRKGINKPVTKVCVMDFQKGKTTNLLEESPLVGLEETRSSDASAKRFASMQRQTCYWEYIPDSEGRVSRKIAYDFNGNELYSIQFYRSSQGLWANIIDRNGQPLRVRNNGADRIRITVDSNGYFNSYMFFNESGVPVSNYESAYGYSYLLDGEGKVLVKHALNVFGDTIPDQKTVYNGYDEYGTWSTATSGNEVTENGRDFWLLARHTQREETIAFPQPDSILPYRAERRKYEPGRFTESYFEGLTPDSINTPALNWLKGNGSYHKMVVDTLREDSLVKVVTQYYDVFNQLAQTSVKYNQKTAYFNAQGDMVKQLCYKNDTIKYSYAYEYKNGVLISQYVLGVDGLPIRCPDWEEHGLCYYKMRLVRDVHGDDVAIKGFNEFGEESLITFETYVYDHRPLPPELMEPEKHDTYYIYGRQTYIESISSVNKNNVVKYIHILDKNGTWYQCGIRDGDLLLNEKGSVSVARPDVPNKSYQLLTFTPEYGAKGAEYYKVYFNDTEMNRYNDAIHHK